jgi:hypothetical protein
MDDPLYQRIDALKMRDRVVMAGFVDDGDLPALYSGALVFAFPSLYEGFGLPPLEAMACGVPVVVADTSSLPEVVGDAALRIDPLRVDGLAAALDRTIQDSTLRHNLISKGYERARQFTWKAAAQQLRNLYLKLLAWIVDPPAFRNDQKLTLSKWLATERQLQSSPCSRCRLGCWHPVRPAAQSGRPPKPSGSITRR